MALDTVLTKINDTLPQSLDRLMALLRYKSISTDSAYRDACAEAAQWLVDDLKSLGADAKLCPTEGLPMVLGHLKKQSGTKRRHVLFYGHYDVQPVDPLALWDHDPFDPFIEKRDAGDVLRGRGASDDKGQLMTFVEACRAYIAVEGSLPCDVTFLFEGEEESGSPSLLPFLEAYREELAADLVLICDTGLYDSRVPAISTMLRGLLGEEVTVTGPAMDLHSGSYGGIAMNPARVLAKMIAGLHDDTGRVTVPGFYEGVPKLPDALRSQWEGLNFDARAYLGDVGLGQPAGEQGYTPLEMMWSRPTCEINGLESGYTGDGFKTVLPSVARAKISFRLVWSQDPHAIRESFRAYMRAQLPEDCGIEFADHGASPAVIMPTDDAAFDLARGALSTEWDQEAVMVGMGGSIPIAGYFKSILGMDSMLIGFAKDNDLIHSPNEKYDVSSFHKGMRSWVRILEALG